MGNDLIRMSGMNSGLDTESIIKALTANSKLKITKQERNVLKLEAQQEAYRSVTEKLQALQSKYFDILNKETNLTGSSMWNKYSSKTYGSDGVTESTIAGLSIATSINSAPGDYKVTVNKNATKATLKGNSLSGNAKAEDSELTAMVEGSEHGFSITVGDTAKNITFKAGEDAEATRENINKALKEAFGDSNESAADPSNNMGLVYLDSDGQFKSREGKGMTVGGIGEMKAAQTLNLHDVDENNKLESGTNTLTFQVGDETVSVSFQTVARDHFDDIMNGSSGRLTDDELETKAEDEMQARIDAMSEEEKANYVIDEENDDDATKISKQLARGLLKNSILSEYNTKAALYDQVVDDYKESVRFKAYEDWKASDAYATEKETVMQTAYEEYRVEAKDKMVTSWLNKDKTEISEGTTVADAYEEYKNSLGEGVEADSIYTWAKNSSNSEIKAVFDKLDDKYEGRDYDIAADEKGKVSSFLEEKYDELTASGSSLGDKTAWVAEKKAGMENGTETDLLNEFYEDNSYNAEKSSWEKTTYNEFSAYKKYAYDEEGATYDLSAENIIDHYTQSNLKNSIGNLETKSGVKFEVNYNNDTNEAEIKAYTKTAQKDEDGNVVKDENGDVVYDTNYKNFSVTAAAGSKNSDVLGVNKASSSISQISNSTKLSELGVAEGEDGKFSFKINGESFSFDGDTTVKDMMKKINASNAGVKMAYSSLDNAFTVTANEYGVSGKINVEGNDALFSALGLGGDSTFTAGTNLSVTVGEGAGARTIESSSNTIDVEGTTLSFTKPMAENSSFTLSIEKDTSAIADTIKQFVEDYNQLIKDVYEMLDEKPETKYYFLADADKEDLDLSEKQEEKWEEKAKKGLLYHDSTVTSIMQKLRTSLMGSITGADGNSFSLSSMGITTATDYKEHGKLMIDEDKLKLAIENHADDIANLFYRTEKDSQGNTTFAGIMSDFSAGLDGAVKATGENKGTLILKAGLSTGSSATSNSIFDAIKRTKSKISTLTTRYEKEEDRLWKKYSAMEKMMGTLNQQQSSMMSYFGQ